MNNKYRITTVSFLAYFVMSGMLQPMGIISKPMAERFNLPITEITAQFSWLTMGIFVGAVAALFVFDWMRLKNLILLAYASIAISLFSLNFFDDLPTVRTLLGIVGFCCGIGLPAAALVITRIYETEQRASMLVITDGFFSIAGFICSWIATVLVARHFQWSGVYQFVAFVALTVFLLTVVSDFPQTTKTLETTKDQRWPTGVWLCIFALFLYTLGQSCLLVWLPNYAETQLNAPQEKAGQLVSQFWIGMFLAQIFVAWWVLKIGVRRLVLIVGATTTLFSIPMWIYGEIDGLLVFATLWGFANLGLLKVVLSFATQMLSVPSARLVSMLLLGATIGTAIGPLVSSKIVETTSSHLVLQFGSACYLTLTIVLLIISRLFRSN